MSWSEVDWDQPKPAEADVSALWAMCQPTEVSVEMPGGVQAYLSRIRQLYCNGGAIGMQCRLPDDPRLGWFISRNRVDECDFLENVLRLLSESGVYPELFESPETLEYEEKSPLVLDGYFAWHLVGGGAYERMESNQPDAKRIGLEAAASLIADRFGDFLVLSSYKPWSSWFYGVAWDYSWFVLDKAQRRLTVLCYTDTD